MFDLEQSIAEWQRQMLAGGIKSPALLEELECHLREEFEEQIQAGMSQQQAFETTVLRIGNGQELKIEFGKDKSWWSFFEVKITSKEWDVKWGQRGPIPWMIFLGVLYLIFSLMQLVKPGCFLETTSMERMSSLTALAMSYLLSWSGLLGHRFFPILSKPAKVAIVGALAGALGTLWLMIFFVRFNGNMGQFAVELSWVSFVPLGALSGLIFGLERAARKNEVKVGS